MKKSKKNYKIRPPNGIIANTAAKVFSQLVGSVFKPSEIVFRVAEPKFDGRKTFFAFYDAKKNGRNGLLILLGTFLNQKKRLLILSGRYLTAKNGFPFCQGDIRPLKMASHFVRTVFDGRKHQPILSDTSQTTEKPFHNC